MSFRDEMASTFNAVNILTVGDREATPTLTSTSRTLTFGDTPGESKVSSLGGRVSFSTYVGVSVLKRNDRAYHVTVVIPEELG